MGAAIIEAIESGLGMVKSLAGEFLDGFSTLFWVPQEGSVAAHLSDFGTFALVMVGVAVSFACITTVISLIRTNTGV